MTKSHERLPICSPFRPMRVIISRAESNSIVLPLCRRLEATGYFTRPPSTLVILRKYNAALFLVEENRILFGEEK